jgi:polyphosphate kinase
MFDSAMDPATRCWVLHPDGEWKPSPTEIEKVRDHQREMIHLHGAQG